MSVVLVDAVPVQPIRMVSATADNLTVNIAVGLVPPATIVVGDPDAIHEAPVDGKTYARQNAAWASFAPSAFLGGTVPNATTFTATGTAVTVNNDAAIGGTLSLNGPGTALTVANSAKVGGQLVVSSAASPGLLVDGGTGTPPAPFANSVAVQLVSPDNYTLQPRFLIDSFSGPVGGQGIPHFTGRRARGTRAAPTAVQNGDPLTSLETNGHDGTGYFNSGEYRVVAGANWSATDHTSYWELSAFNVLANNLIRRDYGSGMVVWGAPVNTNEFMRLQPSGNLSIGAGVNPADSGFKLDVKGTVRFAGGNSATITPGVAATNPITFAQSGTGGFAFSSLVTSLTPAPTVNDTTVATTAYVTSAISTAGGGGFTGGTVPNPTTFTATGTALTVTNDTTLGGKLLSNGVATFNSAANFAGGSGIAATGKITAASDLSDAGTLTEIGRAHV